MKVETVIGDKAYSSKENIDAAKDNHNAKQDIWQFINILISEKKKERILE